MGKFIDLTGQRFGRLTVLHRSDRKSKSRNLYWFCSCSCGVTKEILGDSLKSGKTLSCGCILTEIRKARAEDLTGQRFGRLVALQRDESKARTAWRCKCDCGGDTVVTSLNLKNGSTVSCGCFQRERAAVTSTTHGLCHTRRYGIWSAMIKRCENINDGHYYNYGGRGIKVCEEWRKDFMSFYIWSEDNKYAPHLSIDRIDNNGNYEPENCRWATTKEQNRNTRSNISIEIDGDIKILSEWSEISGVNASVISNRFKSGKRGSELLAPIHRSDIEKTDKERLYIIFNGIKARCYGNPEGKNYKNYGGRGIIMCEEWLRDFNVFYVWALASGYSFNLTLDRINNDGPYSPDNCRWATSVEQCSNKRNNILLTYNGKTKTVSAWARYLGISRSAFSDRVKAGMPDEKLFYKGKLNKLKRNNSIAAGSV